MSHARAFVTIENDDDAEWHKVAAFCTKKNSTVNGNGAKSRSVKFSFDVRWRLHTVHSRQDKAMKYLPSGIKSGNGNMNQVSATGFRRLSEGGGKGTDSSGCPRRA